MSDRPSITLSRMFSTPSGSESSASNRQFGWVFASFFLLVACAPLLHRGGIRGWALVLAVIMVALTLARPQWLAGPNWLWTKFGDALHRLTSPIVLAAVYVFAVIPTGLLMRILRKDPLRLTLRPEQESYWIPREPPGRADARMNNQF